MKLYLSSYKVGNKADELQRLMRGKTVGFIPNARDYSNPDPVRLENGLRESVKELTDLGLNVTHLDLKDYFGKKEELRSTLQHLGGVWIPGGNTFILRQAMKLSGFDDLIHELKRRDDFVYGGYSAGICVLAPNFQALQRVDDPNDHPYPQLKKTIWEGLGILNYIILPHYKSNHPESPAIDEEVFYCEARKIPYKTLRDGEVIITET